jgi:hypothetical protein
MYNIGWGTYPRAIKLQNGTFLGVHTTFAIGNEGQENVIKIKKSTDEGTTWAPIGEVFFSPSKLGLTELTESNNR